MTISLRPTQPDDESFLYDVYRSTRLEEVETWGLGPIEREAFIKQQFTARQVHYKAHYDQADWLIVQLDGKDVGQMITLWQEDELRLVDIALLPEYRSRGIGGYLLRDLQTQATEKHLPIRLHALGAGETRFYRRLGFQDKGLDGPYLFMEWCP